MHLHPRCFFHFLWKIYEAYFVLSFVPQEYLIYS
uniref:Uncharacterized protein n=1 Tax=Rhizophora mucronata TaxID=61149 RepID=A0A2P2PTV0_RHIMU